MTTKYRTGNFNSSPEKQQACSHSTVLFGSGDYYVMCKDCSRTWVKVSMASDDADPTHVNDTITGEERHELTLDTVKVIVEG